MSPGSFIQNILLALLPVLLSSGLQAADYSSPVILLPMETSLEKDGASLRISAEVSDDQGVAAVTTYYRTIGSESAYQSIELIPSRGASQFTADIPSSQIIRPGVEYYVEARDAANNITLEPDPESPRRVYFASTISNSGQAAAPAKIKWWWYAIGAVALGGLAAGLDSGGGNDGAPPANTVSVSVEAPLP